MPSFAREALLQAFYDIASVKPVDKITVKDIVERCGVNRNSFYYHFEDLPHLIQVAVEESLSRSLEEAAHEGSLAEGMMTLARSILQNRDVALNIFHSRHWSIYERSLTQVCENIVRDFMNGYVFPRCDIRPEEREGLIRYFKVPLFGMLVIWLYSGLKESELEKNQAICTRLEKSMFLQVQNASGPRYDGR